MFLIRLANEGELNMETEEIGVYVGIDWSDKKHDVCCAIEGSATLEREVVQQTPEDLELWVHRTRTLAGGKKVAVCLEQSRGALIYALLKYDCFVLYPISGAVLASYREAFRPNGGKDDISDAEFLLELVRTHRDRLREFKPDDSKTRELQNLVEYRRKVVNDGSKMVNRLTSYLKQYFPQVLGWFPDLRTKVACAFLERWSTLEELQKASSTEILELLIKNNSRNKALNLKRIEEIEVAVPLVSDSAIVRPIALLVQTLVQQLRLSIDATIRFDEQIEEIFESHPDAKIFSSFPGAGAVMAARMLAAFGTKRERFTSAHEAAQFFGIAPVVEQSGKSNWVRWRYFCPKFLRQSFHEFAGLSIQYSFWAKQYYASVRARGKSHHVALRALAFKWLRIIWRCWQDKRAYDEVRYLNALNKHGSKLLSAT